MTAIRTETSSAAAPCPPGVKQGPGMETEIVSGCGLSSDFSFYFADRRDPQDWQRDE